MDPTDLSDAQLDQLADQLAGRLPSGTHGDRVVLSRRAFAAAVGGTLGASGLVALGVDPAAAQAAGQVGTSADPVDARLFDLYVANALQSDLDAGGNALTNVRSISTEQTDIKQMPEGSTSTYAHIGDGASDIYQPSPSVDDTETVILDETGDDDSPYMLVLVSAYSGATDNFGDLLLHGGKPNSVDRLGQLTRTNGPSRSYSTDYDTNELRITKASGTHNIITRGLVADPFDFF